jgi:hypothetical protein
MAMADLPGVWSRQAMGWLHARSQMAKQKGAKNYSSIAQAVHRTHAKPM